MEVWIYISFIDLPQLLRMPGIEQWKNGDRNMVCDPRNIHIVDFGYLKTIGKMVCNV